MVALLDAVGYTRASLQCSDASKMALVFTSYSAPVTTASPLAWVCLCVRVRAHVCIPARLFRPTWTEISGFGFFESCPLSLQLIIGECRRYLIKRIATGGFPIVLPEEGGEKGGSGGGKSIPVFLHSPLAPFLLRAVKLKDSCESFVPLHQPPKELTWKALPAKLIWTPLTKVTPGQRATCCTSNASNGAVLTTRPSSSCSHHFTHSFIYLFIYFGVSVPILKLAKMLKLPMRYAFTSHALPKKWHPASITLDKLDVLGRGGVNEGDSGPLIIWTADKNDRKQTQIVAHRLQMQFLLLQCHFNSQSSGLSVGSPFLVTSLHFVKPNDCILSSSNPLTQRHSKSSRRWTAPRLEKKTRLVFAPPPRLFIAQTIKLKRPSLACCFSAGPQVALPASKTGVP